MFGKIPPGQKRLAHIVDGLDILTCKKMQDDTELRHRLVSIFPDTPSQSIIDIIRDKPLECEAVQFATHFVSAVHRHHNNIVQQLCAEGVSGERKRKHDECDGADKTRLSNQHLTGTIEILNQQASSRGLEHIHVNKRDRSKIPVTYRWFADNQYNVYNLSTTNTPLICCKGDRVLVPCEVKNGMELPGRNDLIFEDAKGEYLAKFEISNVQSHQKSQFDFKFCFSNGPKEMYVRDHEKKNKFKKRAMCRSTAYAIFHQRSGDDDDGNDRAEQGMADDSTNATADDNNGSDEQCMTDDSTNTTDSAIADEDATDDKGDGDDENEDSNSDEDDGDGDSSYDDGVLGATE